MSSRTYAKFMPSSCRYVRTPPILFCISVLYSSDLASAVWGSFEIY